MFSEDADKTSILYLYYSLKQNVSKFASSALNFPNLEQKKAANKPRLEEKASKEQ